MHLSLSYFTQYDNLQIHHVAADGIILFSFMAEKYSIMYTYTINFIHSPVNGHLGCFHVFALVIISALNIGVHISFGITIIFQLYAQEWDCQTTGYSYFQFYREHPYSFSQRLQQFTFTSAVYGGPFLYTLSSIYCLQTF